MDVLTVIIHYNEQKHLVCVNGIHNLNVFELQQNAHEAFFGSRFGLNTGLADPIGRLFEGPYVSELLTVERLQEIYHIVQHRNSSSDHVENGQLHIELWFHACKKFSFQRI